MGSGTCARKTGWLVAVLVGAWVAGAAGAGELPPNLVTNPSLEEDVGPGGLPPGWGTFYAVPAGAYRAAIVEGGRTGRKQMRIDFVAGAGEGQFGAMAANRVPLDATKRYVARGWVKVAGGARATADVKLHYYDGDGGYLGQTRVGFATPGDDRWQLVSVTDRADQFPQARLIGLAVACTGDARAQYDDLELLAFDKAKLPADFESTYGVTLSAQQAVLARRVGTWDTRTTIKPCKQFPQGLEVSGVETVRWALGGQLLEGFSKDPKNGVEHLSLMAYDARDRVYRSWYFGSEGTLPRAATVGKWDAAARALTFTSEDDVASVVTMTFVGDDAMTWKGVWKDKGGQVVLEAEGMAKRRPAERGPGE